MVKAPISGGSKVTQIGVAYPWCTSPFNGLIPYGGFPSHGPLNQSFFFGIFHDISTKSSALGYPHDYENLHIYTIQNIICVLCIIYIYSPGFSNPQLFVGSSISWTKEQLGFQVRHLARHLLGLGIAAMATGGI